MANNMLEQGFQACFERNLIKGKIGDYRLIVEERNVCEYIGEGNGEDDPNAKGWAVYFADPNSGAYHTKAVVTDDRVLSVHWGPHTQYLVGIKPAVPGGQRLPPDADALNNWVNEPYEPEAEAEPETDDADLAHFAEGCAIAFYKGMNLGFLQHSFGRPLMTRENFIAAYITDNLRWFLDLMTVQETRTFLIANYDFPADF